jgi:hypothetical protein
VLALHAAEARKKDEGSQDVCAECSTRSWEGNDSLLDGMECGVLKEGDCVRVDGVSIVVLLMVLVGMALVVARCCRWFWCLGLEGDDRGLGGGSEVHLGREGIGNGFYRYTKIQRRETCELQK